MHAGGYEPVEEPGEADVVIFNTCCVRQNADDKVFGRLAALKQLKKERPETIIAVGGCLAQTEGEAIQKKLPHIDIVFGTHNVARLPGLLAEVESTRQNACEILTTSVDFTGDLPAERRHKWHSWLPITVGCDNFCTYCIVPYARGREKSRDLERLVEESKRLVEDGVSEITLLGQNVNSYGRDLYGEPAFARLLDRLSAVDGLERIRFTTSHPKDLDLATIDLVSERQKLCSHFHLPLQAGSDRVLKLMRRKYTAARYLDLVQAIRERIPDAAITTDIMVGFPGETEEDFQQTLSVAEEARFDQAYTFIYSPRSGTAAAGYEDAVGVEAKSERFTRLVEMQNRISLEINQGLVGGRADAFVEALSKKDRFRLAARTHTNKLVHLDGPDELIGSTLSVLIREAFSWFLVGEAEVASGAARGRA